MGLFVPFVMLMMPLLCSPQSSKENGFTTFLYVEPQISATSEIEVTADAIERLLETLTSCKTSGTFSTFFHLPVWYFCLPLSLL